MTCIAGAPKGPVKRPLAGRRSRGWCIGPAHQEPATARSIAVHATRSSALGRWLLKKRANAPLTFQTLKPVHEFEKSRE